MAAPTASALRPEDLRKSVRRDVNAPATIYDGGTTISCRVENVSDGGACVRLFDHPSIPQVFVLTIPSEKIQRRCGLVWRRDDRVGVQFV